jgi:hypothetical protein
MVAFRFAFLTLLASSGIVYAQTIANENPNTIYLTETDSNGVITGGPSVFTSQPTQPAVITSMPPAASLPMLQDGTTTLTYNGATYTVIVSGSSTTVVTPTPTSTTAMTAAAKTSSTSKSKGGAAAAVQTGGVMGIMLAGMVAALV